MRRTLLALGLSAAALLTTTSALETEARACGGCFVPTEVPTIVTDHRMILTVAPGRSTLYDQIRYQGSPESFAWVLPIAGTVNVGLSADVLFGALDSTTQTQIVAPPLNCPQPPSNCRFGSASGAKAAPEDGAGVEVLKHEVVGPYDTKQLKSSDPQALQTWLASNGYSIPDNVKPIIDQYVAEHFDFLVLKLIPGKSVQDMRPVRVTSNGTSVVLPLRMVAAGTGPTVGITLWVVGEGRYEPQNFPWFYIPTDDLKWDWTQQKSNYVDVRAEKSAASGGRGWEIESSNVTYRQSIENAMGYYPGQPPETAEQQAQGDYLPVKDENGNVTRTAAQARTDDLDTLFFGIPTATSRITRMRGDIAHAALDQDLLMTASADQSSLSNVRQLSKEIGQPNCPVFDGCSQVGTAPRDEAFARSSPSGSSFACATSNTTSHAFLGVGASFFALAIAKIVRRRAKKP